MSVIRFDKVSFDKPKKLSNGFLKVKASVTRTGVFKYVFPDGTERHELRLPEEVFKEDSLDSLSLSPLTLNHPETLVTSENAKSFTVGSVGTDINKDSNKIIATLMITDKAAVDAVEKGSHRELSCGYECELDFKAGEYEGQRYDAIQRGIVYNHVALVPIGRAGKDIRIHMDSKDSGVMDENKNNLKEIVGMVKIKLNDIELETTEQVKQAVDSTITRMDAENAVQKAEITKLTATIEAQKAEIAKMTVAHKDAIDPAKIQELVKARVMLETQGNIFLKEDSISSMTDTEIMKKSIEVNYPEMKLDGKSDEYVKAQFDFICATKEDVNEGLANIRKDAKEANDKATKVVDREAFKEKSRNMYKGVK